MTPKERFFSAVHFRRPDKPALEYYYTDVGYAEHGEPLGQLYRRYPGDVEPVPAFDAARFPGPDPADIGPDGRYLRVEKDDWGTTWQYRIFGRIGHAVAFPLDDLDKLADYRFPPLPLEVPATAAAFRARAAAVGGTYPVPYNLPGLFDKMIALRPFEDVLMDIASEEPALEQLADRLAKAYRAEVERALAAGADVIRMGDDYGTGQSLLMSPAAWRRFFFPRLRHILAPIAQAGKTCCFHSCGQVWDILPDLKAAGAHSIWPQLPLYDYAKLSALLRELKLALCLHIDRGALMQHGTPAAIQAEVDRIFKAFRPDEGGSWFYFEVDQGFPFENIEALARAIAAYRA